MRISDWSSDVCSSDLAFIPFRSHVRVRYDARSKTDLPPLITFIDGNRSNRNIERRIAAGIDPSHGAGICAAGVRLDFVDDLHRPQLRRACDRAAGQNRAEHDHWSQPGTNTENQKREEEGKN